MIAQPKDTNPLRTALIFVAILLCAFVALPLVAVAAFSVRLIVLGVLVAALVALALSPRFRSYVMRDAEPVATIGGLQVPPEDVLLARSHAWIRHASPDQVTVGVDELVDRALGPIDDLGLPTAGQPVQRGETLFSLKRSGRAVHVKAPLTGVVTCVNEAVASNPSLVHTSTYNAGWVVRMAPSQLSSEGRELLVPTQARAWLRDELDCLMQRILPSRLDTPVLQDGGELAPDLFLHIDNAAWKQIKAAFFADSEP